MEQRQRSLNPYFFGKCSTAMGKPCASQRRRHVLILIFLENALRQILMRKLTEANRVLILIFLENALRPNASMY